MCSAPASSDSGSAGNGAASRPSIPDYELVRIVGRGSYGDVWLARSVTGAWRAIKIVWRERFANAEPFEREFRGLKEFADISLRESSQMTLLHVGRNDAAGFFYYVMELADDAERGPSIEPASYVPLTLAEMRTRRGRIAADECARIGTEVARVLASLHRRGLVHRDVKPSNVIFVAGAAKLADVGLVAPTASAHTFVGTEGYVPPEGPGAPSADVFALGKVLYELSTGHDRQEFPKLPADLASLPDRAALLELNEIILRACGPTSADRYRDGAAVLADLTALNAGVSLRTRRLTAFGLRVAAIVAGLGVGVWFWQTRPGPPPLPVAAGISPHAVAVLPFTSATGDADQEYFSDGISDEILHALERERDLRVTGSASSFWARDQQRSRVEIAKALGVARLVEGSLQRLGTRLRLDVRLTRGVDGASEKVGTFERDAREVFALEDDVAHALAQKILHRVTMPALVPSTNNPDAYDAFLRGRARQVRIVPLMPGAAKQAAEAAEHYRRAVELDPGFAVAWARLADAIRTGGQIRGGDKGWPDAARAAVERALALQPDLALAWSVRGYIRGVGQRDPGGGLRDLVRAEELGGPNAETLMTRFLITWSTGESRSLLPVAREAVARNPQNIERLSVVAAALHALGDFAEADRLYREQIAQLGPKRSESAFTNRIALRRRWRGAEAALRLAGQAPPEQEGAIPTRARLLAELGRLPEAAQLIESLNPPPAKWEIFANAGLMDRARGLAAAALEDARRKFEADDRSDSFSQRFDQLCLDLIRMEIVLDLRESALARLDEWRREVEQRLPNRRSAGLVSHMPVLYATLGQHDAAIEVLRRLLADGIALGYDLRDSPGYASMRDDPRFLELRRQAEDWASTRPDPLDDSVPPPPRQP